MSLTLQIVSRHRRSLGERGVMQFGHDGGTIGRSLESDWSLPDAQRFLSGKHASIDYRSGTYYIVDTSKNGVFINDAEEPVGRGKPQRLFPGDKIRIGEYEMSVSIEAIDDTRESLINTSHVDPVDVKLRVEAPEPTSYDLVEAHAITGVGIEMFLEDEEVETLKPLYDKYRTGATSSRIEAAAPQPPAKPAAKPRAAKPAAAKSVNAKPAPKATVAQMASRTVTPQRPAAVAGPTANARDPLAAFFRGAGIDAPQLSAKQTEEMLTQLGQVTRELIVGVIDCLHLRSLQKAQLKQSNTTIQPRENNRLKFSANVEEGFSRLFVEQSDQYLSPVESVRSAFADLKGHQRALLSAIRKALGEYLDRLEPEHLEQRAANGRSSSLINAANKLRYWDLYKDVYSILANRSADELPQPFLDAFAQAYADETDKGTAGVPDKAIKEAN